VYSAGDAKGLRAQLGTIELRWIHGREPPPQASRFCPRSRANRSTLRLMTHEPHRCRGLANQPAVVNHPDHLSALQLVYQENAKVAAAFWEWRHKIILLCAVTVSVILGIASWMYTHQLGGVALSVPFAVGAVIAGMCRVFDRRNGQILDACFRVGADLERRISDACPDQADTIGIYAAIIESRSNTAVFSPPSGTYSHTLRRAYFALAIFLVATSLAAVTTGLVAPDLLIPRR
jgi:hypothetical protein